MTRSACVSIDVDTLSSIYKGNGLTRAGGYTFLEFRTGLASISRFFEEFRIPVTLFMVGTDLIPQPNRATVKAIAGQGHELANHSMTHPQGFRWLSESRKEKEIAEMGDLCESITGIRPVGFRSPGWNMDDSGLPVLRRLGYIYDSSVFPTLLMPAMKAAHYVSMFRQPKNDRTTMGMWRYMLAPVQPYRTTGRSLVRAEKTALSNFPFRSPRCCASHSSRPSCCCWATVFMKASTSECRQPDCLSISRCTCPILWITATRNLKAKCRRATGAPMCPRP